MATRSPRQNARRPLREHRLSDTGFPNLWRPLTPTVTPDESIIRQRGRKGKTSTPTRSSPRKSPRKSLNAELNQTDLLDDSSSSLFLAENDNETPGRSNSAMRGIRKRLVLYQDESSEETDFLKSYTSPPKRKTRRSEVCELAEKLQALSQDQIIDVVLKIVGDNQSLEKEILNSLPDPDVTPLIKNLEYLQRNIYKSLPNSPFGSRRDAYCYRRVKTHVMSFKAACVGQGKELAEANSWSAVINYVQRAWEEVGSLPDWDDASHCKTKEGCYRSLAALTKQALKNSSPDLQEYDSFKEWLLEVQEERSEMKACLTMLEKKLQSSK